MCLINPFRCKNTRAITYIPLTISDMGVYPYGFLSRVVYRGVTRKDLIRKFINKEPHECGT